MRNPIVLLTLLGIATGLFIGILDSFFHFVGFEDFKILNLIIFILFFIAIYWSINLYREKLTDGFLTYVSAFRNTIYIGIISSLAISAIRFVFLKYISKVNMPNILNKTEQTMLDHYSLYKEDLIDNRLSFIEFSYDPVISSIFYFFYYMFLTFVFSLIASFFLRRIDRNISL